MPKNAFDPPCEQSYMERAFTQMMRSCTGDSLHKRQVAMHDAPLSSLYFMSKPFQALVTTRYYRFHLLVLATWSLISSMQYFNAFHYFNALRYQDHDMVDLTHLRLAVRPLKGHACFDHLKPAPNERTANSFSASEHPGNAPEQCLKPSLAFNSFGLMLNGHMQQTYGSTLYTDGLNATLTLPGLYRANGIFWSFSERKFKRCDTFDDIQTV